MKPKIWGMALVTFVALVAAGCSSHSAVGPDRIDTSYLSCPDCDRNWLGYSPDDGYGSNHYTNLVSETRDAAVANRVSPEQAEAFIRKLHGDRADFWNYVPSNQH